MTLVAAAGPGCGDDGNPGIDAAACSQSLAFDTGGDGHADPLGTVGPGQARAGRLSADILPRSRDGLAVWEPGDFVLANDRVAILIEDVGASDLYDPWGGRPVGITQVEGGQLTAAAEFGELFILTGRFTVLTQSVTVINDGSNGEAAVIRASGPLAPLPFFTTLVSALFPADFDDITAAIEYVLEPDSDHVDIYMVYNSPRLRDTEVATVMHGFMYTSRMPPYAPDIGFDTESRQVPYIAFVSDEATSYAYSTPGTELGAGIYASGFASNFGGEINIAACSQTRRLHARLTIGGPGLDGLLQVVAEGQDNAMREISGVVLEAGGAPAVGVRVHATAPGGGYITRVTTDQSGSYRLHAADGQDVELTAYRRGDAVVGPVAVAAGTSRADLTLGPAGFVHVIAVDDDSGVPIPSRIQILPVDQPLPGVPGLFGEPQVTGGRLHVEFAMNGEATMRVPAGQWEVVASRGYEYELARQVVNVGAGETIMVNLDLARVVDTTGYMCADYHIHTHRSNDSSDDASLKLRAAVADGLEIPIRSEHEFVDSFQSIIEDLGLEDWAYGVGSVEMTSFQAWGHMGVLPLEPDPSRINNGTPVWQRFPTADDPGIRVESMTPPEVFAAVRARPEEPIVIINHPRGGVNYFTVADYDPLTGMIGRPEFWDEEFRVVEFFNNSGWVQNYDGLVRDWLSLLDNGRRMFAVGSSDSHGITGSPVGYPRTCLDVGTDNPRDLSPELIRDETGGGHSTVSGGIYVYALAETAGPGDELIGAAPTTMVHVRVEAASWVDVDAIDIVVDGERETIAVLPQDADPGNPTIRYEADIPVTVAAGTGSYVIVAAYGDESLEPVHPGKKPFGVTNPIFLRQ